MIELDGLKAELQDLLQDMVETRPLDSLEMLVVRTTLRGRGITIDDDQGPTEPTLQGWMQWVRLSSANG